MRLRVRFVKLGKVRWTSHRDVARMWERAFRRVRLPVAYTGGFSPRPKVSFGLALPTGCESLAEYLDVELASDLDGPVEALVPRLSAALPTGVDATAVGALEAGAGSLQELVTSCTWTVELPGAGLGDAGRLVREVLDAGALVVTRERKGRPVTDDLRPAVVSLTVAGTTPAGAVLEAELETQPRGVRPGELLAALEPSIELGLVRRTHQWIERDGARWEPLPPQATDAPHAEARAS